MGVFGSVLWFWMMQAGCRLMNWCWLIKRRLWVDELAERSNEIDRLRCLPQDLAERMAALGFYRMIVPADLGWFADQSPQRCVEFAKP